MSSRRLLIATILATALILAYNNHLFTDEMLITTHLAAAQVPPVPAPPPSFPNADDEETIAGNQLPETGSSQLQLPQSATPTNTNIPPPTIQITSHQDGSQVPVGELTIQGTSSDNQESNCQVYADVNDISPLQNATSAGTAGGDDYSQWTFTYTQAYQLITQGVNELTAKISCFDNGGIATIPVSEWHSVNVTGVASGATPITTATPTSPIATPTATQTPTTAEALGAGPGTSLPSSPITPPSFPFATPEEPSEDSNQGLGEGAEQIGDDDDGDDDDGDDDDGDDDDGDDDDGGEGDDG